MAAYILTLPQELQNEVYRHLFANVTVFVRCEFLRECRGHLPGEKNALQSDRNLLAVTRTCKRVRKDSMNCFFSTVLFDTWNFHLFKNCPRREDGAPKDEGLEQCYLESLSKLQRVKLNPWQLFRSDVTRTPARILGNWSSFRILGLKEVRTNTNLLWNPTQPVFCASARPDKRQEINNIARIMKEAPALLVFMDIAMAKLESMRNADNLFFSGCLKIAHGHIDIVLQPDDAQAQVVLQQYVGAINAAFVTI